MSEEALKAEAARFHQQRVLEALGATFPHPLHGTEDAHARKRWANLVTARLKIWPFDTIGVATLFDVALKGRAWNEYQQFPRASEAETDKEFSARVVDHFLNPPKLKTTEVADFMKRLQLQKLKSGESLEDVFYSLQKEISRLNWEGDAANDLLIATFVGMLPPDAQLVIKARDKVTPQLALEIAQRTMKDKDASIEKDTSPWSFLAHLASSSAPDAVVQPAAAAAAVPEPSVTSRDVESIVERTMSAHTAKVDELTASLKALTEAFQSSKTSENKNNRKQKGQGHINSIQNNGRPPCQICGRTNHTTDRCYSRGNTNAPSNNNPSTPTASAIMCQLCDSPGHIAKDCNRKPPVTCHGCGQTGHIIRFCKQRQPRQFQQRGYYQPRDVQPTYQDRHMQGQTAQQHMQSAPQGAVYYNAPPPNNFNNQWGNR